MRRRILVNAFLTTILVFVVTAGATVWILVGVDDHLTYDMMEEILLSLLPAFGVMLLIALLCSALIALFEMRQLIDPINAINPENPTVPEHYTELQPLINRIRQQNSTISKQVDTLNARQIEFTAMTEKMEEGFVLIGSKGDILSFNNSAQEIFGRTDLEVGAEVRDLNSSGRFLSVVRSALNGRHGETHIEMGDRSYQVIVNPVMDAQRCFGAVLLVLDVTEREQREALRREFTANVSHELKTPLTAISGSAELMKSGLVEMDQMKEFSGIIYDESQRLIALIEDIIKLSRLDEDDFIQEKELVDLRALSQSVAERLAPTARKRNITLKVEGERVTVNGIRQILDEMIYNLVDNGIKYNHDGGSVTIRLRTQAANAIVTVSDTGIGIPAESRDRVFERFYRVDKSHSKNTGGTGLGLSIVKHGAILHDARIELESEEGKGTAIAIIF